MSEHQWSPTSEIAAHGHTSGWRSTCSLCQWTRTKHTGVCGGVSYDHPSGRRRTYWPRKNGGVYAPPCPGKQPVDRCTYVERIGIISKVECQRPALPRLVVCEHHATPDTLRLVILAMAAEIERLKSGG